MIANGPFSIGPLHSIGKEACLNSLKITPFIFGLFVSLSVLAIDNAPSNSAQIERGRKNWFNNMYDGWKFIDILSVHPDPTKRVSLGFAKVVETPRAQRFQTWGTINDPDCRANPQGGPDLCKDPEATGVIGIRKVVGANGKVSYGISCASCHAGFNPLLPPRDPNEATWSNIHPTIGNQFLDSGKIFSANMDPQDVRRLMLAAWPKGTADTTLLFNDGIMNPGTITAFWNVPHRPTFDVGMGERKNRGGQGGEDDVGSDLAALRVYTNIGVCFNECVGARPGLPIDVNQCRRDCKAFPPQNEIDDLVAFMRSTKSPKYPRNSALDPIDYVRGQKVFSKNCASCHGGSSLVLSNDEVIPLKADPANTTNACRSLANNWETGQLWSQFSSQLYKDRVTAGDRGYRVMPLAGIWSTAPFLHNQAIGYAPSPTASVEERGKAFEVSMLELLSKDRTPKINVTPMAVGPYPAGTPLAYIFNRDAATGVVRCDDIVENRGHHYGADLSAVDKRNLIHWLKYQ